MAAMAQSQHRELASRFEEMTKSAFTGMKKDLGVSGESLFEE